MNRAAGLISITLLLASCTAIELSERTAQESDELLTLHPSIQARITALLKDYRPKSTAIKLTNREEIRHVGNFGKLVYAEHDTRYVLQDSGLWANVAIGGFTDGASSGIGRSLSLCGLITVLMASNAVSNFKSTSAVPFGKVFVPFGIGSSMGTERRVRVKALEAATDNICSPSPGARFTYRYDSEGEVKMTGLFGSTISTPSVVTATCQAAPELRPAKELVASLRGDYLPVSCDTSPKPGRSTKVEHAFLIDPGIYVPLSAVMDIQTTKVQYRSAEYGQ